MVRSSGRYGADHVLEAGDVVGEFDVGPLGSTNSQPCQLTSRSSASPNSPRVEALDVGESRRVAQPAVESVRPGVVRADDAAPLGGRAARQQFVAAVSAGVGERADRRRRRRAPAARRWRPEPTARCAPTPARSLAWPTHVQPEKMLRLFPLEHRGVDVRRPRQHARTAERCQRRGEIVGGNRRRTMLFEHTVSIVAAGRRSTDRGPSSRLPIPSPNRTLSLSWRRRPWLRSRATTRVGVGSTSRRRRRR